MAAGSVEIFGGEPPEVPRAGRDGLAKLCSLTEMKRDDVTAKDALGGFRASTLPVAAPAANGSTV